MKRAMILRAREIDGEYVYTIDCHNGLILRDLSYHVVHAILMENV